MYNKFVIITEYPCNVVFQIIICIASHSQSYMDIIAERIETLIKQMKDVTVSIERKKIGNIEEKSLSDYNYCHFNYMWQIILYQMVHLLQAKIYSFHT